MSKICDRNYQANFAYTVKMIKGVGCCPACKKPTFCHGKPVEQRALFWFSSNDTGISSMTLARHMANMPIFEPSGPPSDADDRGRCIRLLELIPEWLPRLNEMIKYDTKKTDGFVINSSGISAYDNSWSKQIKLIIEEGKL